MTNDDMMKLLLLPITLPIAMAKGAVDGAMRAALEVIDDVAGAEAAEDHAEEQELPEPVAAAPAEPDLAVVPEPAEEAAATVEEPAAEPLPDDETGFPSEVETAELLEPETPSEVAGDLGLPSEEPTRGEVADFREREREAETTDDSPGAVVHVDEPWDGYRSMSAPDVVDRLRVADEATKAVVLLYEEQHRGRKSVLDAARREP